MLDQDTIWALHDVFDEMLERDYRTRDRQNALAQLVPPIDVEPLNQHDSKAAFLLERRAVDSALEHSEALFRTFTTERESSDASEKMLEFLTHYIDVHARKNTQGSEDPSTFDIVKASARMAGLHTSFLWLLVDMIYAFRSRDNELKDQEKEFWIVKSRPPNYHARTIALRTARVYAREAGERPKFGTQRDSGAPSTAFARALERIFTILEIKAGVRGPAQWAIEQLTDEDLRPLPKNYLAEWMNTSQATEHSDHRKAIANALMGRSAKSPDA